MNEIHHKISMIVEWIVDLIMVYYINIKEGFRCLRYRGEREVDIDAKYMGNQIYYKQGKKTISLTHSHPVHYIY